MKMRKIANTIPEKKCVYITDKIKCTHGIVFLQTHYVEVVFLSNYAINVQKSLFCVSILVLSGVVSSTTFPPLPKNGLQKGPIELYRRLSDDLQ